MAAVALLVGSRSSSQGDVTPTGKPDAILTNELVLIPGGEFRMGLDSARDHSPAHTVYIESFFMNKYEVTNAQYLEFCEATRHQLPEFWEMDGFRCGSSYPNHPVVGVSWNDALSYTRWCGKRLPTEAEWEYAARGGLESMAYPTGNTLRSSDGNYTLSGEGGPVAVGSYPPNGFGLYDMQGNVVEWVRDYYDPDYYSSSPSENPQGPRSGKFRVIRGGGWHSGRGCNKVFYRNALPPGWLDFNVGFRCAQDTESG